MNDLCDMKHLTVEEMIDFVSFNKLDNEFLSLASKVNTHILRCDECREKVTAFQMVYDELVKMGRKGDFSNTVLNKQNANNAEEKKINNLLDGYLDW